MKIQSEINEEIEKRINIMESPEYEFPKRFHTKDYIIWGTVISICFLFLLIGATL